MKGLASAAERVRRVKSGEDLAAVYGLTKSMCDGGFSAMLEGAWCLKNDQERLAHAYIDIIRTLEDAMGTARIGECVQAISDILSQHEGDE